MVRCDSCFWMREIRIVYFLPICRPDPTPRYRVRFTLQARMISLLLTSGCFDGIDNSKEKVDPSLSLLSCYRHFISARLSHRSHSLTPGIGNSVVPIPPLFWSSSSKLQLTYLSSSDPRPRSRTDDSSDPSMSSRRYEVRQRKEDRSRFISETSAWWFNKRL